MQVAFQRAFLLPDPDFEESSDPALSLIAYVYSTVFKQQGFVLLSAASAFRVMQAFQKIDSISALVWDKNQVAGGTS